MGSLVVLPPSGRDAEHKAKGVKGQGEIIGIVYEIWLTAIFLSGNLGFHVVPLLLWAMVNQRLMSVKTCKTHNKMIMLLCNVHNMPVVAKWVKPKPSNPLMLGVIVCNMVLITR